MGTSLVVQWLRLHSPSAGGTGSIPGQGTSSHIYASTKSPHAATKTRRSQINKYLKKKKKKGHGLLEGKSFNSLIRRMLPTILVGSDKGLLRTE